MSSVKGFLFLAILLLAPALHAGEAQLTETDRKLWILCIKRVKMKPPCCGACQIITREDSRAIWEYLTADSDSRRQGKNREIWLAHKDKLLAEFKTMNPERYRALYENEIKGESK